jgi:magnesium transporter
VAEASRRLDQEPTEVTLEEILDLKRAVLDLEAVAEERVAVLETLGEVKHPLLDIDTFENEFRVVLGNTAATLRRAERLERRGADLQFRYDSLQQETTNRRLSRLTIISAIFLPLTLVAGIYGMNFEIMPELHFALGYPIVLGAMAIGGLGLLWWFRARGWMD